MPRLHARSLRTVGPHDRSAINGLMAASHWRHAHLDWLDALDLVGRLPYLMIVEGGGPVACLACPPDPPGVAWIRAFAGTSALPATQAWEEMWPAAAASAASLRAHTAAALTAEAWMEPLLQASGFSLSNRVIFLEYGGKAGPAALPAQVRLRAYQPADLQAVFDVDRQAFEGLWRYSEGVLRAALAQAAVVTVLEVGGQVVGYQLSTASALGAHLARLAVRPEDQGHGFGRALVEHLLREAARRGLGRVSVNTQQDNLPSLRLYRRLGFRDIGLSYPVYTLALGAPRGIAG